MTLLPNREGEERPWGSFDRFTLNESSTVKILRLNPHMAISLQQRTKRSEFWRILSGSAIVTIGERELPGTPGIEFEIPPGTKHRIKATDTEVVWLEIALGHFDEHDEVRLEDDFGRG